MVHADPRDITTGIEIARAGYCDQPYVVTGPDGRLFCVMTRAEIEEGDATQRIVFVTSSDSGASWTEPADLEPADGPEASWAMPLLTSWGRLYVFYTYNSENLRSVISDDGPIDRVDTLGDMCFRFSDDEGLTWSERHQVPVREFDIDSRNPYHGAVRFWWGVGKPKIIGDSVYIGAAKVGRFGEGFMAESEGFFLRSDNILTERDPARLTWVTLPEGPTGVRAPDGSAVADEHNLVGLPDGTLFATYRTTSGHNAQASSRDQGATWMTSFAEYTPGGRRMKHPRAANFVWDCGKGRYLLWFHNHGGRSYADRNPVWLAGGVAREGRLYWSEPEIALFSTIPAERMSYPDLVPIGDDLFVTETQKSVARLHRLDPAMLRDMWSLAAARADGGRIPLAESADSSVAGTGFTVQIASDSTTRGRLLASTVDEHGAGIEITQRDDGAFRLTLADAGHRFDFVSETPADPARDDETCLIVDTSARIVLVVRNGLLEDGGAERERGWEHVPEGIRSVAEPREAAVLSERVRIHPRPLRVAQAHALTQR